MTWSYTQKISRERIQKKATNNLQGMKSIHKYQLCFYIFVINYLEKISKQLHFKSIQKNRTKAKVLVLSRVQFFTTPQIVANQAPLSCYFPGTNSVVGLPVPSPGDLPNPGIKFSSPALQADSLLSEPQGSPRIEYQGINKLKR